mgnify:CR=1 FL=1
MKIYILSNQHVEQNTLPKLKPYLTSKQYISYIWSINGLMEVENRKIYNVRIKDEPVIKTLIGAYPATIDKSEFIRENECFQISPRSCKEYTELVAYKLTHTSKLEWIFEFKDNVLSDNYFTLPNDVNYELYYNEILKFLQV